MTHHGLTNSCSSNTPGTLAGLARAAGCQGGKGADTPAGCLRPRRAAYSHVTLPPSGHHVTRGAEGGRLTCDPPSHHRVSLPPSLPRMAGGHGMGARRQTVKFKNTRGNPEARRPIFKTWLSAAELLAGALLGAGATRQGARRQGARRQGPTAGADGSAQPSPRSLGMGEHDGWDS